MALIKYDPRQVVLTISRKFYENWLKTQGLRTEHLDLTADLQIKGRISGKKGPNYYPNVI